MGKPGLPDADPSAPNGLRTNVGQLRYDQSMRYGQRGGYTPAEQERRERLRLGAAERFARGDATSAIAADLRVTERTVRRWRRPGEMAGPRRCGPRGRCRERLSPQQRARLEAELRRGPLAHGFAGDQRWTLGRIKTLIGRLFRIGYTVEGTWKLIRPGTAGPARSRCARRWNATMPRSRCGRPRCGPI